MRRMLPGRRSTTSTIISGKWKKAVPRPDAFVDKVQVFEGGRISVNLVYDDCLEELLQVKNKREGDLNE